MTTKAPRPSAKAGPCPSHPEANDRHGQPKKNTARPGRKQPPSVAAGRAERGWERRRLPLKPMPLQKEFESLRSFAEGYGLTAEKLARMARALERYPDGEKKGVLESLRSLAEQRRIPHGRLTRLAETMAYEPELERQIEAVKEAPAPPMRRMKNGARRGRPPADPFAMIHPVITGESQKKKRGRQRLRKKIT